MYSRIALVLAVALSLILMAVAPCLAADEPAAKDAAVIVLKHTSPSSLMRMLGLVSAESNAAGQTATWYRSAAVSEGAKISSVVPTGVDIVVPCDADKSLIVYGAREAIDKFLKVTAMLDVPAKQVQIKGQFYRLTLDRAKQLGLIAKDNAGPGAPAVTSDPDGLIRSALKDTPLVVSPIISTINNQLAYFSISSQIPYEVKVSTINSDGQAVEETKTQFIDVKTSLSVLPRVNGDGTITLTVEAEASSGPNSPHIGETILFGKTQRRVSDGESMIITGPPGARGVLVLLVTPTVIK